MCCPFITSIAIKYLNPIIIIANTKQYHTCARHQQDSYFEPFFIKFIVFLYHPFILLQQCLLFNLLFSMAFTYINVPQCITVCACVRCLACICRMHICLFIRNPLEPQVHRECEHIRNDMGFFFFIVISIYAPRDRKEERSRLSTII